MRFLLLATAVVLGSGDVSSAFSIGSPQSTRRSHSTAFAKVNDDDAEDRQSGIIGRRDALRTAAATAAAVASTISSSPASAIDLPFFGGGDVYIGTEAYKPGKRCTCYLIDQTIPPSLIPYRPQREAAILKKIGEGGGTNKKPFIADEINLNNFMNKVVFGTADAITGAANDVGGALGLNSGGADVATVRRQGKNWASFVFLGANFDDADGDGDDTDDATLALRLLSDICRPREREGNTAIALASIPMTAQEALDAYLVDGSNEADTLLLEALGKSGADSTLSASQLPILQYAKSKRYPLLALGVPPVDLETVVKGGLQSLDADKRQNYVADAQGFIALTQDPKYKMYADRSLLKDAGSVDPGNFFAQKILEHEAAATVMAKYATKRPDSIVVAVAPMADVRFMGGINGRVPRVCGFLTGGESKVDEEAVTTILLNPSARETLSQSKFIRLEIGTSPAFWALQTKVADYLWFSKQPKVNMLPRMMNEK